MDTSPTSRVIVFPDCLQSTPYVTMRVLETLWRLSRSSPDRSVSHDRLFRNSKMKERKFKSIIDPLVHDRIISVKKKGKGVAYSLTGRAYEPWGPPPKLSDWLKKEKI
jgi:RIO-like serine/threonine protein kinase